jgi:signal transduction histidine kinase
MKLFTKYSRINLLTTVLIFLLASLSYYFLLRYVLINQVDKDLRIEEDEIQTYVSRNGKLPEVIEIKEQPITYLPVQGEGERHFENSRTPHTGKSKHDHFRQLLFYIKVKEQWYEVNVGKSLAGTDEITRSIILITILTIVLILSVSLLLNRLILRKLWQPFYNTLQRVQHFELGKPQLPLNIEPVDEFNLLNTTLQQALGKAEQDYLLLKQFTENASHEMQTPLAIIRSKLDLLIQDEDLTEPQSQTLQGAYNAIQRLSHLNQSLLLLAKIENRQFIDTLPVHLTRKIEEKIFQFKELWESKHLLVTTHLEEVVVTMNAELADLLLNNLFSNVNRHSTPHGQIGITLNQQQLVISNTGAPEALPQTDLFTRFFKQGATGESNGLGLSIIQQICHASGYRVSYQFHHNQHHFTIHFYNA